jgi:hypothetical protein
MPNPLLTLRVRPKPPYPQDEGAVTLMAEHRPRGGYAIRMRFDDNLAEYNPLTARSLTEPVFHDDDPERGFLRAREWLERHFEILGERL